MAAKIALGILFALVALAIFWAVGMFDSKPSEPIVPDEPTPDGNGALGPGDDDEVSAQTVRALAIPPRVEKTLIQHNVETIEEVAQLAADDELQSIDGIGPTYEATIREALDEERRVERAAA